MLVLSSFFASKPYCFVNGHQADLHIRRIGMVYIYMGVQSCLVEATDSIWKMNVRQNIIDKTIEEQN